MQCMLLHDGYGSCSNSGELRELLGFVRLMNACPSDLLPSHTHPLAAGPT